MLADAIPKDIRLMSLVGRTILCTAPIEKLPNWRLVLALYRSAFTLAEGVAAPGCSSETKFVQDIQR
jgi:hypothetical protein